MEQRIKNLIKKHGLSGVNKPKKTPSHPTKKGIVLAKEGDRVKLIRFGDQNMGHNYSPEARKGFKSRHAKNIAKGKMSAAYWSDKAFWGGEGADKKMPPKSQKYTRGLKKYAEGGKVATKSNPSLWKRIVASVKANSKGGDAGEWSARKAQLAVQQYKKSGGDYKGPKKETSLSKWTKQDWTTSSGKPSEGKRRYLPKAAWSALSSAQKAATNKAKAKGDSEGKQFVSQPKSIAEKVAKYRS
jgi:hypothetical protein